jgi:hypothetical protein
VLIFSGWHGIAALTGFRQPELDFTFPRAFLIGRSIAFALISLLLAIVLYTGQQQAPKWTLWGGIGIVTWSFLEHVMFSPDTNGIPAVVIFYALFWSAVILTLRHPGVRSYFQEFPA